jgi:putative transposase
MTTPAISTPVKGFRHPREIISYAVWAYFRFSMSLRDVEDLLAQRGIIVSYETIRVWVDRFGQQFARCIRRDRPMPNDKWHLDEEMVITIKGEKFWLWRAVDGHGDVLDILMQSRRNAEAAMRFMRKLLKKYGKPRVVVTDKLGSYGCALRALIPGTDHRSHKGLNNRAEASHRHTRRREKIMARFKSPGQAQTFLAAHDQITTLFRPHRHTLSAVSYRHARADAFSLWGDYASQLAA